MINNWLSKLFGNNKFFNSTKKDYDDALTWSGHDRLKGYDKSIWTLLAKK